MITTENQGTNSPKTMRSTADLLISVVAFAVFLAAFFMTLNWPIEAARFPRIVTGIGAVCSGLFLLKTLMQARKRPQSSSSESAASAKTTSNAVSDAHNEDAEDEEDVGYVFATAGARAWVRALLWIASFFVLTYLFGVYLAGGLFAVLYLRFGGKKSWLFSCGYALILSVGLWALFDQFLQLPLPRGLLGLI